MTNQSRSVFDVNDQTSNAKVILLEHTPLKARISPVQSTRVPKHLKVNLMQFRQKDATLLMHCSMASEGHIHRIGSLDSDAASFEMASMINLRLAGRSLSACSHS